MKKSILLRSLKQCYISSPFLFIANLIFSIFLGFGEAIKIYILQNLINNIQNFSSKSAIITYITLFFFVNLFFICITQIQGYINQVFALKIEYLLEKNFINKTKILSLKHFDEEHTYNLISKAQVLGQGKVVNIYIHFVKFIQDIISIMSIISLLISYKNEFWWIILVVPILSFFVNRKMGEYAYNVEKSNVLILRKSDYIKYLLTNNIAIKEIITFQYIDVLLKKFIKYKEKTMKYMIKLSCIYNIVNVAIQLFELIVKILLISLYIMKSLATNGLVGNIMGFIYSIENIQLNFMSIFKSLSEIYKDKLYAENYFEFIDIKEDNLGRKKISKNIKEIILKNVTFSYGEKVIINKINVEFTTGKPIVIIGENGSGKSTLIKLIAGLYNEYEGEIFVNDVELKNIDKKSFRDRIAILFQDYNQYEFTLRENISMSDKYRYDDTKIFNILEILGLKNKVDNFDNKLDTQMGKWFGGEELSKGQWQRIGLAKMLIKEADVIIMDEPTSALDPNMEKKVIDIMNDIASEKIVIIVTHNLELLKKYDVNYFILKDGKICKK
ncbi:TPA: ATP-binding cassette domain-containing protein [Streptococcus agalactiae]